MEGSSARIEEMTEMTLDLRILHLEDDPTDADIVREALETEGITSHPPSYAR